MTTAAYQSLRVGPLRPPVIDWGAAYNLSDESFAVLRFDAAPGSPARTRRFLRRTLSDWSLLSVLDEASAVAAELVANAIRHALQPALASPRDDAVAWIALVHRERSLICAVSDPSPTLPVPVPAEDLGHFAETGRGLVVVAELSDDWGHSQPDRTGKTVWARIPVPVP
jgi:hypothetical protein